jgi:hypothetical protein
MDWRFVIQVVIGYLESFDKPLGEQSGIVNLSQPRLCERKRQAIGRHDFAQR